jgi:hypothetical protein
MVVLPGPATSITTLPPEGEIATWDAVGLEPKILASSASGAGAAKRLLDDIRAATALPSNIRDILEPPVQLESRSCQRISNTQHSRLGAAPARC